MLAEVSTKSETVVLVVEDDRDDFFLTQDILKGIQREPHRVIWAATYEAAKLELEERAIDVALVDYRIDGRTGLEFIAEVGSLFPHVPMILLTGLQDPDLDLAAQGAGAVDYIAKDSLSIELLDRSIRYAIQNRQRWSLLDRVLTSAASGVISLNSKGAPVVWNKRALEALALDLDRKGKVTGTLVREALDALMIDGEFPEEFAGENGKSYQLVVSEGPDGGNVLAIQDISSRARTEQLLRQAAVDAEAANQAKSNFLATMSHELRTPLNGILGMARVLEGTNMDPAQRDHVSVIRTSGESLLKIINDILDLSKIEAGKVELEDVEFELAGLMDDLAKLLAPTAYGKNLELAVFIDPALPHQLHGDPLRVKQILINLVGNAIKFTTTGSVVVSAVREMRDGLSTLRFSVIDTGNGIAPEKVEKLFKKFSQVDDSTTRNHSGTGLGLALCRELTRLMNGTIWYEPTDHRGSAFHFRLPLREEHEAVEQARIAKVRTAPGCKVLLASSSRAVAKVLDSYTKAMDHSVIWVQSEREAINALQQNQINVVLYDQMNPVVEQKALSRALRQPSGEAALLLIDQYPAKGLQVTSGGLVADSILLRPFGLDYVEFVLRALHKASAQPEQKVENRTTPAATSRLRVLMAEDNAPNRLVASALLRAAGHELEIAEDGLEAFEKAMSRRFDVILMDVQMPRLDGLAATRKIRGDAATSHIPIIGLTAGAMKQDRDRCIQAGMSDYLAKPVDWDKLLTLLDQIERAIKSRSSSAA